MEVGFLLLCVQNFKNKLQLGCMITINVHKQSNFPVNATKIKKRIKDTLVSQGLVSDFQVSVALVGEAKMNELVKTYYHREGDDFGARPHPILTFPTAEMTERFIFPPEVSDLGEMVISFPQAVERAKGEGRLVQEIIEELAEHGALHLAGIHNS